MRILGTTAKMPWWNVCFAQSLGQLFLSLPSLYISGQQLRFDLSAFQIFLIVASGTLGAWSQVAMTVGMQREKSAVATGMRMSDVVFGFIWQVLLTQDNQINVLSILGAMLVVCSIFLLIFAKEHAANKERELAGSAASGAVGVELGGRDGKGTAYLSVSAGTNELEDEVLEEVDFSGGMGRGRDGSTAIDVSLHSEADVREYDDDNDNKREEAGYERSPLDEYEDEESK